MLTEDDFNELIGPEAYRAHKAYKRTRPRRIGIGAAGATATATAAVMATKTGTVWIAGGPAIYLAWLLRNASVLRSYRSEASVFRADPQPSASAAMNIA